MDMCDLWIAIEQREMALKLTHHFWTQNSLYEYFLIFLFGALDSVETLAPVKSIMLTNVVHHFF